MVRLLSSAANCLAAVINSSMLARRLILLGPAVLEHLAVAGAIEHLADNLVGLCLHVLRQFLHHQPEVAQRLDRLPLMAGMNRRARRRRAD